MPWLQEKVIRTAPEGLAQTYPVAGTDLALRRLDLIGRGILGGVLPAALPKRRTLQPWDLEITNEPFTDR